MNNAGLYRSLRGNGRDRVRKTIQAIDDSTSCCGFQLVHDAQPEFLLYLEQQNGRCRERRLSFAGSGELPRFSTPAFVRFLGDRPPNEAEPAPPGACSGEAAAPSTPTHSLSDRGRPTPRACSCCGSCPSGCEVVFARSISGVYFVSPSAAWLAIKFLAGIIKLEVSELGPISPGMVRTPSMHDPSPHPIPASRQHGVPQP